MLDTVSSDRGRVVSLAVLFVVAGFVAASTAGTPIDDHEVHPRAHLEALLEAEPATPVLVPQEIPEGYALDAPISATPHGGPGTTWVYRPVETTTPGDPLIGVCIVPDGPDLRGQTCTPEGSEAIARHEHDGYTAFVVPLGSDADHLDDESWQDLDLTASWEDVDWIDG